MDFILFYPVKLGADIIAFQMSTGLSVYFLICFTSVSAPGTIGHLRWRRKWHTVWLGNLVTVSIAPSPQIKTQDYSMDLASLLELADLHFHY